MMKSKQAANLEFKQQAIILFVRDNCSILFRSLLTVLPQAEEQSQKVDMQVIFKLEVFNSLTTNLFLLRQNEWKNR